ncbi:hypothetical protein [Nitrospira sp. Nam80]
MVLLQPIKLKSPVWTETHPKEAGTVNMYFIRLNLRQGVGFREAFVIELDAYRHGNHYPFRRSE